MATESQPEHQPPPGDGYEPRDANAKWVFGIIGGLFLAVVAAEFVMNWVKEGMEKTPPPADQWLGSRQPSSSLWTQSTAPRLQVSAPTDLRAFRAREEAELNTYGWINQTTGVVRIPIERAMDLVLERGLPVRAGINQSRLGPTPFELQQQRTNATQSETIIMR